MMACVFCDAASNQPCYGNCDGGNNYVNYEDDEDNEDEEAIEVDLW